jgi:hypothetical protein
VWRQAKVVCEDDAQVVLLQILGSRLSPVWVLAASTSIALLHTHTSPWRNAVRVGSALDYWQRYDDGDGAWTSQTVVWCHQPGGEVELSNGVVTHMYADCIAQHGSYTPRVHADAYGVPPHLCAITQECITGIAAVTANGQVYQEKDIRAWFATGKTTDPITNVRLASCGLHLVDASDSTAVNRVVGQRRDMHNRCVTCNALDDHVQFALFPSSPQPNGINNYSASRYVRGRFTFHFL